LPENWPLAGSPDRGVDLHGVGYIDWYIPKMREKRDHDLSKSGLPYDWALHESADSSKMLAMAWAGEDPRQWIAEREQVSVEQVALAQGVTQGISLAILAMMPPADGSQRSSRIAVEMPAYGPTVHAPRLLGLEAVPFDRMPEDLDGAEAMNEPWLLDRGQLSKILPTVGALVLTPVLNPTGWGLTKDDQEWLVAACAAENVGIISDEVYLDISRGYESYRPFHREGAHCASINSLTKCYGLEALRFGWVIASPERAAAARRALQSIQGEIATPSIILAKCAWPHLDRVLIEARKRHYENTATLGILLKKHGYSWTPPPDALFGAIRLPDLANSFEIMDMQARDLGILAVPGDMFHPKLGNWMRISWTAPPDEFKKSIPNLDILLQNL